MGIKEDVKDCSISPSDLEKEMLKRVKRGQAVEIAKKVKKEKKHSEKKSGLTSQAVAADYVGNSIAQPKERKHKKEHKRSVSPAPAEQPAMAALPAPAPAPAAPTPAPAQDTTAVEDVRAFAQEAASNNTAAAPMPGKGGKGGTPAVGGKGGGKGKKGPPA